MKNAPAKRAKILFFIVKYVNLWGFCCRRRRGCLSSLISMNVNNEKSFSYFSHMVFSRVCVMVQCTFVTLTDF